MRRVLPRSSPGRGPCDDWRGVPFLVWLLTTEVAMGAYFLLTFYVLMWLFG